MRFSLGFLIVVATRMDALFLVQHDYLVHTIKLPGQTEPCLASATPWPRFRAIYIVLQTPAERPGSAGPNRLQPYVISSSMAFTAKRNNSPA